MTRKLFSLFVMVLLTGCGKPHPTRETTIHFTGRVEEIEPLSQTEGRMILVHSDPYYALTIQIKAVSPHIDQIKPESAAVFAIHSPTKLFAKDSKQVIGETYHFSMIQVKEGAVTRFCVLKVERD